MDTTPLIITDWRTGQCRVLQSKQAGGRRVTVEGGATDIVTLIVKKVLQGVTHRFRSGIQEVNAERLADVESRS